MSKLKYDRVADKLNSYLNTFWKNGDVTQFSLVYARLLLLFEGDLSQIEVDAVLERRKQLRGEKFNSEKFSEVRMVANRKLSQEFEADGILSKNAMLNRMMFCLFLDSEEHESFYLTEPIFEFARVMEISPKEIQRVLEMEFDGFAEHS